MEKPVTETNLEKIRSEIDAVDEAMLRLLERRFAAIEIIKAAKKHMPGPASPMRPAREAEIVRRLLGLKKRAVPSQLVVRLWRGMISAATGLQADVRVHMAEESQELRDLVRDHFLGLQFEQHAQVRDAIEETRMRASDVAVVRASSNWILPVLQGRDLSVIGTLPLLAPRHEAPLLLILGHAKAEPSQDDETLVTIPAGKELPVGTLWSVQAGPYSCVSFSGFLDETSAEILQLKGTVSDVTIVGRCPSPLEARS
jgi:chorismate mutase